MNMISLCHGVFLLFLASALSIQGSVAQDLEVRQQIRPLQTDAPPLIDGVLDDAVWAQAESHNNFRQTQPILDADPSEGSWFRIAYDSAATPTWSRKTMWYSCSTPLPTGATLLVSR